MDHVQYLAQVVHFLKNDESTHAGILKYEIVNVSDLILSLKTAGVRCSRQKLETILDDLSILRSRNSHGSNRGGRPAKESSAPAEALCQCVYILVESKAGSLKVASATYVGYTTNPEHRLRQHNGEIKGGAKKTAFGGRQWKIAAVVYGFPNKKCALQFEYALQHPSSSAFFGNTKVIKAKSAKGRLHNLALLLRRKPFNRLDLSVQVSEDWVEDAVRESLAANIPGPGPVVGPIVLCGKFPPSKLACGDPHCCCCTNPESGSSGCAAAADVDVSSTCELCGLFVKSADALKCFASCNGRTHGCNVVAHVDCMADHFLEADGAAKKEMVPTRAPCPACHRALHWSSLVKHQKKQLAPIV